MRIIARFEKNEAARYVSHLDVQRLFQRAMHRAKLPMAYSQGFNPHPLVSFATALAVGYTSSSEWVDVKLNKDITEQEFINTINGSLPNGFFVKEAKIVPDNAKSLTAIMQAAEYEITASHIDENAFSKLMSGEIVVTKKTKAGMKEVNIRPDVLSFDIDGNKIKLKGRLDAAGSLNVELLMGELKKRMPSEWSYRVHRNNIIFDLKESDGNA